MQGRDILIFLSMKYNGDFDRVFDAIKNKEKIIEEEAELLLSKNKAQTLTLLDDNYPEKLKNTYKPPLVLYYYGDISLIDRFDDLLAVIGSRKNSKYGEDITNYIIDGLDNKKIIVSGLAKGIDSIAHRRALYNKGKTIAVLGSGIDRVYPCEHKSLYEEIKKEGLIISEYPLDTAPSSKSFPERNRIIAGISKDVLVTECHAKSGTSITIGIALHNGRNVYVAPYPFYDKESNCNNIIKQGAYLCDSAEDILEVKNF